MIDTADLRAAAEILDRRPSEAYMLNKLCRDAANEIDGLRAAFQSISNLDGHHDLTDAWKIARAVLTERAGA